MTGTTVNTCHCPVCQREADHPDKVLHRQMNIFLSRLDEQQRRWYVALESKKIGHGGDKFMSLVTGAADVGAPQQVRGRRELDSFLENRPVDRVRVKKRRSAHSNGLGR